jgi:hypothetical protein
VDRGSIKKKKKEKKNLIPNKLTREYKETQVTLAGNIITMADENVDF